ncbi:MAG: hypothetical protein ACRDZ3_10155 [Acidimicrobiia bacterium]
MGIGAAVGALAVLGFTSVVPDRLEVRAASGDGPAGAATPAAPIGTSATAPDGAARITWAEGGDIWVHDVAGGERRRLTHDGEAPFEYLPRFHGRDRVTFVVREGDRANLFRPGLGSVASVVREIDLTTGRTTDLARFAGGVAAQAWSPDGSTLALLSSDGEGRGTELRFVTRHGDEVVRTLPAVWGRGTFDGYDETRVEWAGDGRHLLVLETGFDTSQDETLYVLRADGSDALPPRGGTWARWGADSRTLYCECAGPAGEGWFWQALDIDTGVETPLLIDRAMRPSLSPDGQAMVFDDGEDTPAVHVLELGTGGRSRRLVEAAVAPRWIDAGHVVVTDTRPCPDLPDECMAGGHGSMFDAAGTTSVVDVATGERRPIDPFPTEGADIAWFEL